MDAAIVHAIGIGGQIICLRCRRRRVRYRCLRRTPRELREVRMAPMLFAVWIVSAALAGSLVATALTLVR